MDRGGTITWYLTANDADFLATMRKARAEAKATAAVVDKDLTRGGRNASDSLRNMAASTGSAGTNLRTLRKEAQGLATDTNVLKAQFDQASTRTNILGQSLGNTALRSYAMRDALSGVTGEGRSMNAMLGATALRGFTTQMGGAGAAAEKTSRQFKTADVSLDDFHRSIGRSASAFRNLQIALRGFELTSLIIGASIAVGAMIELAGAVFAAAGALYAAPAAVSAFAGALATIKIATGGVADAFKELGKQTGGVSAATSLAKKQTNLMKQAMKQDEALTRRLTGLKQDYADVVQELAEERIRILNEQILKGVEAWDSITDSAKSYLDVSKSLTSLTDAVTTAQDAYNTALITYGPASQQAITAARDLYAAQAAVADANSDLDKSYGSITDNIKDLATNLTSLQKANRNEMAASLLNLKAMRLDKQARGESTAEIEQMVSVLEDLIAVKDTRLTLNPDLGAAQRDLDAIKAEFPQIAVASSQAASSAENSLTKSLANIAASMDDVRRERAELQAELQENLAEAASDSASGAAGKDPFEGLSRNARSFVLALKDVQAAFQPVKETIQDNFFAGLDTTIKQVATTTFPLLQVGLGGIATAMNGFIKETARVVQEPFFTGALSASMETTRQSVTILQGAIEPLLKAFTDLVNIGNPYVLMLSEWIVKQSELFAAYTGSEEGQKAINQAIKDGIDAFKSIAKFAGEVIGLLTDLFKISNEGTSIVDTLTGIVKSMREWLKEGENADKVRALFEAVNTILSALATTAGVFVVGILDIVKAYNDLDGPAKDIITNILVLSAILTPLITYASSVAASFKLLFFAGKEGFQLIQASVFGVQKAMAGFQLAQQGLSAAQIASSDVGVGAWGRVGAAISKVKDGVGTAVSKVGEMSTKFATVATDAIKHAGTIAAQGAKAAAGWVSNAARVGAAWVTQFVLMIARSVAAGVSMAASAVVAAAAWVAGAVATAAAWVIANAAMLGVWGLIIAAVIGAVALIVANWDSIVAFFQGVWDAIVGFIRGAIDWVVANWPLLLAILLGPIALAAYLIAQNWEAIKGFFAAAWEFIKEVWGNVLGFFQGIWDGIVAIFSVVVTFYGDLFSRAWEGIKNIWNAVIGFFRGIWDGIVRIFSVAVTFYADIFRRAWEGIKNIWNSVGGFFRDVWNNIVNAFSGAMNLGGDIVRGLWNGISNMVGWVTSKIRGFGESVLGGIKSFFGIKSPSRVMRDQVGKMLGYGIADGITDSTGEAVSSAKSAAEQIMDAFAMSTLGTDFSVNGDSTLTSQFAPSMTDTANGGDGFGGSGVVINQTNEVYSDVDMDQVNRNLTWEMSKV